MREEVEQLYAKLIAAWNEQNAARMAACFAVDGICIGFDGSLDSGRGGIAASMSSIFASHEPPRYVTKVRSVRPLGPRTALLLAVAGIVPRDGHRVIAEGNAHQTVIAEEADGVWQIVLLQNTPAQFHGRRHLVAAMTSELQAVADEL